jgi:hypothetical protein
LTPEGLQSKAPGWRQAQNTRKATQGQAKRADRHRHRAHHPYKPMPALVKKPNETLRGFGNYHRHVVASEAFSRIDRYVDEQLWRMLHRRYPKKSKTWLSRKYWGNPGHKRIFSATGKTKKGNRLYPVIRLGSLGIQRYIKVKADANPYLPQYGRYFWRRRHGVYCRPCRPGSTGPWPDRRGSTVGTSHKGVFCECLSGLTGNCHEPFLGGKGVVRPLTYPVMP